MKILNTLPFIWIATTSIYTLLLYVLNIRLGYTVVSIGLFVPISLATYSTALEEGVFGLIIFPIVLAVVWGGEYYLQKYMLTGGKKFLWIVTILFSLTIIIDLIIWGTWASFGYLLSNALEDGM